MGMESRCRALFKNEKRDSHVRGTYMYVRNNTAWPDGVIGREREMTNDRTTVRRVLTDVTS